MSVEVTDRRSQRSISARSDRGARLIPSSHVLPSSGWIRPLELGDHPEIGLRRFIWDTNIYLLPYEPLSPLEEALERVSDLESRCEAMMAGLRMVKARLQHLRLTSTDQETTAARFKPLFERWHRDTAHLSADEDIAMHPAYQQIIGLGEKALTLILTELQTKLGHWFWALTAITGENPVPENERGSLRLMREHWLQWGRSKGYLE